MAIGFSISLLLVLLIKLFFIIFLIGIIGGLVFITKNYIFTPEDIAAFKGSFAVNKSTEEK